MSADKFRIRYSAFYLIFLIFSAPVSADDWAQESFKVPAVKGAVLAIEYPEYWGKPQYSHFDNVVDIKFGPFGPRKKPFFLVALQSVPLVAEMTEQNLIDVTQVEVENFSAVAFETEIPITSMSGANNAFRFFSITDKQKKWGEFDYMTMAVIASGNLLSKCYFYSSDGAPDFGADAIRFIESIQYTQPPPKVEKKEEEEEGKEKEKAKT